jgi:hypothetical protein
MLSDILLSVAFYLLICWVLRRLLKWTDYKPSYEAWTVVVVAAAAVGDGVAVKHVHKVKDAIKRTIYNTFFYLVTDIWTK